MNWELRWLIGSIEANHTPLNQSAPLVIGRSRSADIRIDDPIVSRRHCKLSYAHGRWRIEDLKSVNGTLVNGQRVVQAALADGDVLSLGSARLRLARTVREIPGDAATQGVAVRSRRGLPPRPAAPLAPAHELPVLGRRYQLLRLLHRGSGGEYYLACRLKRRKQYCVRIVSRAVLDDPRAIRRLIRGLRIASALRHPNIVRIHHAGQSESRLWMAMEYVDGPSLRQYMARYGVAGQLATSRVLQIGHDIGAALEAGHRRQIVHRAVSPDSILLTSQGRAKLTNFSLLRGVDLSSLHRVTTTHEVLGELPYTAPEAIEPDGAVDCRADLYGLGACLYTLLTGQPPFTGIGTTDLVLKVRSTRPTPPSRSNLSVSGPLESLVMRCLAKSPMERYQTPREFLVELERIAVNFRA